MSKKFIRGIPATALTLLGAAGYGLLLPSPALASHTCTHYVIVLCQNWQDLEYSSQAECLEVESMGCGRAAAEAAGKPALAAGDRKLPRPAVATAADGSASAGAAPASVQPASGRN